MSGLNQQIFTLSAMLENSCMNEEHSVTFIYGETEEVKISYGSLRAKALEFLGGLQEKGISAGDEVIICLDDNQNFLYAFWACILGGIIPVPVAVGNNDEYRMKLLTIWDLLNRPFLLCDREIITQLDLFSKENGFEGKIREIAARFSSADGIKDRGQCGKVFEAIPEDIAFIQFSSGSTGDPKGVVLTHENVTSNIQAMLKVLACTERDSTLSWMPLTHDMGLIGFHLAVLAQNINQFLMPTALFIKNPSLWMKKAWACKITILSSPNFGLKYFLTYHKPEAIKDVDLSGVRIVFNGAEPICADICREFLYRMERYHLKQNVLFCVFGMAEASLAVSFPVVGEGLIAYNLDRRHLSTGDTVKDSLEDRSNSIELVDLGYGMQDCSIRVCGDSGIIYGENTIGNIEIKGKNVTPGYYNNPDATRQAITDDGWLKTGDIGFLRNHRLVVTGRAKDIIFINGQNYYPHDIENACYALKCLNFGMVAVCGVFSEMSGTEETIVFILHQKDMQSFVPLVAQIKKCVGKKIGLEISRVVPVSEIPKTASGKIQRYKLRDDYKSGRFSEVLTEIDQLLAEKSDEQAIPLYDPNVVQILGIVRDVLGNKNIGAQDDFYDLGVDSIKALQIVSKLKEEGLNIEVNDILNYHSVYALCANLNFDKGFVGTANARSAEANSDNTTDMENSKTDQSYLVRLEQEELDEIIG